MATYYRIGSQTIFSPNTETCLIYPSMAYLTEIPVLDPGVHFRASKTLSFLEETEAVPARTCNSLILRIIPSKKEKRKGTPALFIRVYEFVVGNQAA